jgi:hypothetical protein
MAEGSLAPGGRYHRDQLRAMTGDPEVVDLVETLTRRVGGPDRDYLSRCAAEPMTLLVKRLDLADKLIDNDSAVPATVANEIRRQARERLGLPDRPRSSKAGRSDAEPLIRSGRRSTRSRVVSAHPEAWHRQAHQGAAVAARPGPY